MNKPKFSLDKAQKAVEISSKIEGHKIPRKNAANSKRIKAKVKSWCLSYSNPKGNADTERFFRTFKEEVVWSNLFDKVEDVKRAVENFITFYNNDYPHSTLGYVSPIDFIKQKNHKKAA